MIPATHTRVVEIATNGMRILFTCRKINNSTLIETINEIGKKIRMNYAFPAEIASNKELFSNTLTTLDSNSITFDGTTP